MLYVGVQEGRGGVPQGMTGGAGGGGGGGPGAGGAALQLALLAPAPLVRRQPETWPATVRRPAADVFKQHKPSAPPAIQVNAVHAGAAPSHCLQQSAAVRV